MVCLLLYRNTVKTDNEVWNDISGKGEGKGEEGKGPVDFNPKILSRLFSSLAKTQEPFSIFLPGVFIGGFRTCSQSTTDGSRKGSRWANCKAQWLTQKRRLTSRKSATGRYVSKPISAPLPTLIVGTRGCAAVRPAACGAFEADVGNGVVAGDHHRRRFADSCLTRPFIRPLSARFVGLLCALCRSRLSRRTSRRSI